MSGGTSCLSITCTVLGLLFAASSVAGIGLALFLVFGEPLPSYIAQGSYTPSWEDIGPALIVSVVSLLANVLLIGGARQLSKDFLLVWVVWKSIAICIFWLWFGYNQLKHYGYIDWTRYGMRGCLFCDLNPESTYVVFGGAVFSVILLLSMVPVEILRSRLKKRHRELTEPLGLYNSQHNLSPYVNQQQQQQYEMYQQQQNEMLRRQVLQHYEQYPPPSPQQQLMHDYTQSQQWQYYPGSTQHVQYR